jgi:hypothetical protein
MSGQYSIQLLFEFLEGGAAGGEGGREKRDVCLLEEGSPEESSFCKDLSLNFFVFGTMK